MPSAPDTFRCATIRSIDLEAPVDRVYRLWARYEDLPRILESVRRTQCITQTRVLWDVDLAARQVVWEARIVEQIPDKLVRWESTWGARNAGLVRFEALGERSTRLTVEIRYEPRSLVERLGARLGLVDRHVRRDLARFRAFVEHGG